MHHGCDTDPFYKLRRADKGALEDEVERTSALVFLEEHGKSLIFDEQRLHKVYFVLENILGSPVDGQGMTYSLKSQARFFLLLVLCFCSVCFLFNVHVCAELATWSRSAIAQAEQQALPACKLQTRGSSYPFGKLLAFRSPHLCAVFSGMISIPPIALANCPLNLSHMLGGVWLQAWGILPHRRHCTITQR